ncbi:EAL domain-containing protein [Enterovibrio calviensis]|uniref:EAL domain-containing protein n=1 Tax=Enterovibrio calviensis TaxID=91359 RepID=UPI000480E114|nr:EAL domain-containing protein [Enterovibrio calviensis]
MKYYLQISERSHADYVKHVLLSFLLVLISTKVSWFAKEEIANNLLLSVTTGAMVAVTCVYGRSGVLGAFLALISYYLFNPIPSGVGLLYTLVVTVALSASVRIFEKYRHHAYANRAAFSYYVFFTPGLGALSLALFAPDAFSLEASLNLYLTDSIGVLITTPIIVLALHCVYHHDSFRTFTRSFVNVSATEWIYKLLLIGSILLVLNVESAIVYHRYLTYLLLAPLVILAVFNFSELAQVALMIIGYSFLFQTKDPNDLAALNTKLAVFSMFCVIIYIMLEYKLTLKRQIEKNTKNLYNDAQSHFGTFQKLNALTLDMNDFLVCALDLRPAFKYPLEKRDAILRQIAYFFKHNTAVYDLSFMLYDVSSLVFIVKNTPDSVEQLESIPEHLDQYLQRRSINYRPDRIYYCRCQKGIRIKPAVNRLNVNMRLADKHMGATVINCDETAMDDYITLLDELSFDNIRLLKQSYLNLAHPDKQSFELLSQFSIDGKILNTAAVFQFAQRLGYLDTLENMLLYKQLGYLGSLDESSYDTGSINLTPEFLCDTRAVDTLVQWVKEHEINTQKVVIEIVESGEIENQNLLFDNLNTLKSSGFKLALDDFGAGHATYNQLLTMPVDSVKIDGSLVRNCIHDPIKCKIIENLKAVADTLKINVVAECVETDEEASYLKALGIGYLQGYLIHKPTAVEWVQ